MGKNAFIVYKSENPTITVFFFEQMLKCFRNHLNMNLTTKSDYFMPAFTSIYLLIASLRGACSLGAKHLNEGMFRLIAVAIAGKTNISSASQLVCRAN